MILISKREAFELRKICGSESVKKSHSRYPKYYLVEGYDNLKQLRKLRRNQTVKTVKK